MRPDKNKDLNMSEIIFLIEEAQEGGFIARAMGHSIFTEAENEKELKENIKNAVMCHFDKDDFSPAHYSNRQTKRRGNSIAGLKIIFESVPKQY